MNKRTFYNEVLTDHNRYPGTRRSLRMQIWCLRV